MSDLALGPRLHGRRLGRNDGLVIGDALARFEAAPGAVGWTYGPRRAEWFVVDTDGALVTSEPGSPACRRLGLGEVFELHLTAGGRHLRWRHHDAGRGRAVATSESESALAAFGEEVLTQDGAQHHRRRLSRDPVRLLAGETSDDGAPPGWVTLRSGRLGSYRVPLGLAVGEGHCPAVRFAEYAVRDDHGNVDVVDTAFLGFTTVRGGRVRGEEGTR